MPPRTLTIPAEPSPKKRQNSPAKGQAAEQQRPQHRGDIDVVRLVDPVGDQRDPAGPRPHELLHHAGAALDGLADGGLPGGLIGLAADGHLLSALPEGGLEHQQLAVLQHERKQVDLLTLPVGPALREDPCPRQVPFDEPAVPLGHPGPSLRQQPHGELAVQEGRSLGAHQQAAVVQGALDRCGVEARVEPVRNGEVPQSDRITQMRGAVPRLGQLLRFEEACGQAVAVVVVGLHLEVPPLDAGHPGTADDGHPRRHGQLRAERPEHLGAYGERARRPERGPALLVGVESAPHRQTALGLHHATERTADVELQELRPVGPDDQIRTDHGVGVPLFDERVTHPQPVLGGGHLVGRQPVGGGVPALQGGAAQQIDQRDARPEDLGVGRARDRHRRRGKDPLVRPAGVPQLVPQHLPDRVRRRGGPQPVSAEPRVPVSRTEVLMRVHPTLPPVVAERRSGRPFPARPYRTPRTAPPRRRCPRSPCRPCAGPWSGRWRRPRR